jgi:NADH-quinone oxidoreductase subunit N
LLSVGKAAGLPLFCGYFTLHLSASISDVAGAGFRVIAAVTMTVGNVIAIQQNNIKRMRVPSIAQAGYVMVGIATVAFAPTTMVTGQSSILFFLAGYALTNLGAFIAIIAVSNKINSDQINDFAMGKRLLWWL